MRLHQYFVHKEELEVVGGSFYLGIVVANKDEAAAREAQKKWPHWKDKMVLQRLGTKQLARTNPEAVKA